MPLSAQQMVSARTRPGAVGRVGTHTDATWAEVLATGVADPYDTSLFASGLSVDPCAPGSTVDCLFTVSHERPFTGIELHAAVETWTGCVVEDSSGLVIALMSYVKTTLWNGQYHAVRLVSTRVLPSSAAGASLTVYAGPWEQFTGLVPGMAFSGAGGVLSAGVTAASAPNPKLPSTPGTTTVVSTGGSFWSSPLGTGTLVAGGLFVVIGGGIIAYHAAAGPEAREHRRLVQQSREAARYERAAADRARAERAPSYGPIDADWSEAG